VQCPLGVGSIFFRSGIVGAIQESPVAGGRLPPLRGWRWCGGGTAEEPKQDKVCKIQQAVSLPPAFLFSRLRRQLLPGRSLERCEPGGRLGEGLVGADIIRPRATKRRPYNLATTDCYTCYITIPPTSQLLGHLPLHKGGLGAEEGFEWGRVTAPILASGRQDREPSPVLPCLIAVSISILSCIRQNII